MSLTNIVLNSPLSATELKSVLNLAPGQLVGLNNFIDFLGGTAGGVYPASLAFKVGAVQATGTLTVAAGGSANNQQMAVCNVIFTAKTSGATGNEFNISATAATQATNMANAINASANLTGKVTAVALNGVVTLTAAQPGLLGNGLNLDEGSLANVTKSAFANGADGTSYTLNLL